MLDPRKEVASVSESTPSGTGCSPRRERYLTVRVPEAARGAPAEEQAGALYDALRHVLEEEAWRAEEVIWERIFVRDVRADVPAVRVARAGLYDPLRAPATGVVEQPPCLPGAAYELQAYLARPGDGGRIESLPGCGGSALSAGKLLDTGRCRHLYLSHVVGIGDASGRFGRQTERIFQAGAAWLAAQGAGFRDVVRTWFFLADMEGDYEEFNGYRRRFFQRWGVVRRPASTGIQGKPFPSGARLSMDLYALLARDGVKLEPMHTPTLNEAFEYGSDFSRGMLVDFGDRRIAYVSGTASVDEEGRTAHPDDALGQIERTLLNIRTLLEGVGGTLEEVVHAVSYLKRGDLLETFEAYLERNGLAALPTSIVQADVCRPELLVEIEVIAVLPPRS